MDALVGMLKATCYGSLVIVFEQVLEYIIANEDRKK